MTFFNVFWSLFLTLTYFLFERESRWEGDVRGAFTFQVEKRAKKTFLLFFHFHRWLRHFHENK